MTLAYIADRKDRLEAAEICMQSGGHEVTFYVALHSTALRRGDYVCAGRDSTEVCYCDPTCAADLVIGVVAGTIAPSPGHARAKAHVVICGTGTEYASHKILTHNNTTSRDRLVIDDPRLPVERIAGDEPARQCVAASSVFHTAQWKCLGQNCPDRAPRSANTTPTCYTCGQTMSRVQS